MIKKICFIGILLHICLTLDAQKFLQVKDKAFNFGGKVGFNATFPIINSLTIDGNKIDEMPSQEMVILQINFFNSLTSASDKDANTSFMI